MENYWSSLLGEGFSHILNNNTETISNNEEPAEFFYEDLSKHMENLVRKRTFNHLAKLVFFDIQAIIECGFTLKRVRDMIRTYSQVNLSQDRYGPQLKFSAFLSFNNK